MIYSPRMLMPKIAYANQSGMVLITALLYLLVVTFLVVCAFSTGMLQTKISAHFNQELQAFEYAESALWSAEEKINVGEEKGEGSIGAYATYKFSRLPNPTCGVFYQVDVIAMAAAAQVHLQSIFTFPHSGEKPCEDIALKARRMVWRQVNE